MQPVGFYNELSGCGRLGLCLPYVHKKVKAAAAQGYVVKIYQRLFDVGRGAGRCFEEGGVNLHYHRRILVHHAVISLHKAQFLHLHIELEQGQQLYVNIGCLGTHHGVAGGFHHAHAVKAHIKRKTEAQPLYGHLHAGRFVYLRAGYVFQQGLYGGYIDEPRQYDEEYQYPCHGFQGAPQPSNFYKMLLGLFALLFLRILVGAVAVGNTLPFCLTGFVGLRSSIGNSVVFHCRSFVCFHGSGRPGSYFTFFRGFGLHHKSCKALYKAAMPKAPISCHATSNGSNQRRYSSGVNIWHTSAVAVITEPIRARINRMPGFI